MYIAVNESSTHTVDNDLPCEVTMPQERIGEEASSPALLRKQVSFADEALLYSSPLFIDEVRELWYTQDEYASLKEERRTVVKLLRYYGMEAIKRKVCIRGLEAYTSIETNRALKEAREKSTYTVLHEQRLQRELGFYDPDALRDVYVPTTQWLRDHALRLARNDSLSLARMRLPLTQSVPTNARDSFQSTMTHQRSQRRVRQEESNDHMDGIISKLENTMHLGKAPINTSSRTCYDDFEPVHLNRI